MSTSQIVESALQPNGASASAVEGLQAAIARDLSAQSDASSAASPPSQAATASKPTGMTEKIRRDAAALRNALAFTQAIGVLMRSPHYRQYTLGDLEWLVIPPLIT